LLVYIVKLSATRASEKMLKYSIRLVIYYLKYGSVALRAQSARKLEAICASQQRFAIA
jgi:thiamine monophosphate synthase